jgi:hypothetical protein
MPRIERWDNLPTGVRQHLIERMRDRAISVSDLDTSPLGRNAASGARG